jgi:hypothetical protein
LIADTSLPPSTTMRADPRRQNLFANAMTRISALPSGQRVDALLDYFEATLNGMEARTIRTLRDQIMERFATCGASYETCTLMIELIDTHLALREREVASSE